MYLAPFVSGEDFGGKWESCEVSWLGRGDLVDSMGCIMGRGEWGWECWDSDDRHDISVNTWSSDSKTVETNCSRLAKGFI